MATEKRKGPRTTASDRGKGRDAMPPLPAGYEDTQTRMVGFFARKPGNTIEGILRGSFVIKGKFGPKRIYRIEITNGETDIVSGEDESTVDAGLVGLDETGYLKRLADLSDGMQVFVRCLSKGPDEKDPWIFQTGFKTGDQSR